MRIMREDEAVAAPSPCRMPRPAVVAACTRGPMANTAKTMCAASSSFSMIGRLPSSVDAPLQLRPPEPGVAQLQLGDLPVGALDDLPAAVGLAVAHHHELGIVDRGGVVDGELFAVGDVADGHQR